MAHLGGQLSKQNVIASSLEEKCSLAEGTGREVTFLLHGQAEEGTTSVSLGKTARHATIFVATALLATVFVVSIGTAFSRNLSRSSLKGIMSAAQDCHVGSEVRLSDFCKHNMDICCGGGPRSTVLYGNIQQDLGMRGQYINGEVVLAVQVGTSDKSWMMTCSKPNTRGSAGTQAASIYHGLLNYVRIPYLTPPPGGVIMASIYTSMGYKKQGHRCFRGSKVDYYWP